MKTSIAFRSFPLLRYTRRCTSSLVCLLSVLLGLGALSPIAFSQGSLTPPPGQPMPTMKTLDQVQPRRPISSLPFTINQPGSYYFTRDLTMLDSNSLGITITSDNVTLDLNGFSLVGGGKSSPGVFPVGIWVPSPIRNFTMRNGTIRNWGYAGISAGAAVNSRYECLRAVGNVADGFFLGNGCSVSDCVAVGNGNSGIVAGSQSTIRDCSAWTNGYLGIAVGEGAAIFASISVSNTGPSSIGMLLGVGSTIEDCTARGNNDVGIWLAANCRAVGNTVTQNRIGIYVNASGNRIDSNVANRNALIGIWMAGSRNLMVRNYALENKPPEATTCNQLQNFADAGGNQFGPIVLATGTITSASGWENFSELCVE